MTARGKVLSVGIHTTSNLGDVAIAQVISMLFVAEGYVVEQMDFNFRSVVDRCLFSLHRNGTVRQEENNHGRKAVLLRKLTSRIRRLLFYFVYTPLVFLIFIRKSWGSRKVFVGGGNLLMGMEYGFPLQALLYALFGRVLGKSVIFLCVGAGPFTARGTKTILKMATFLADRIVCRDRLSGSLIERDLGVPARKIQVLLDPVLLWPVVQQAEPARFDVLLTVLPLFLPAIFRGGSSRDANNFKCCMIALASELARTGRRVGILVTDAGIDLSLSKDILASVESETGIRLPIEVPATPCELAMLTRSAKVVFSTRMHGAIMAMSQHVPAICIAWQPKIKGLYADLGLPECLIELDTNGCFSLAEAHALIARLTENRDYYAGRIRAHQQLLEESYRTLWSSL